MNKLGKTSLSILLITTILVYVIFSIISLPSTSSLDFSNTTVFYGVALSKTAVYTPESKYPKIIVNRTTNGLQIANFTLIKNTERCSHDCEAIIKVDNRFSFSLPNNRNKEFDFVFYDRDMDLKNISNGIFISTSNITRQVPVSYNCTMITNASNGTSYQLCNIPNNRTISEPNFQPLTLGTSIPAGVVYFKLTGSKPEDEDIEWYPNFLNLTFPEWANWNSTEFGYELSGYFSFNETVSVNSQHGFNEVNASYNFSVGPNNRTLGGKKGNAMRCNPTSGADAFYVPATNSATVVNKTYSAWVWLNGTDIGTGYAFLHIGYVGSNHQLRMDILNVTAAGYVGYQSILRWGQGPVNCNGSIANNTWTHIVYTGDEKGAYLYQNGEMVCSDVGLQSPAAGTQAIGICQCVGGNCGADTDIWPGSVDELSYWQGNSPTIKINSSDVAILYNSGLGFFYGDDTAPPILDPPVITFNYQTPPDLDSSSLFAQKLNISYNFSNASTFQLYFKINSTESECMAITNLTCDRQGYLPYQSKGFFGYNTTLLNANWLFDDNFAYPVIYNINETEAILSQKSNLSLTGANDAAITTFYNVSNTTQYSFLELDIRNLSAASQTAHVYYCNESYQTGNSIKVDPNCFDFADILATQVYNHTHGTTGDVIRDRLVPMPINNTNGQIGLVKVTPFSRIAVFGALGGGWNLRFLPFSARSQVMNITGNNGITQSTTNATPIMHMHQFTGSESIWYFAWAYNDSTSLQANSTVREDLLNLSGLPPSEPNIIYPTTSYYNQIINITYVAALSPNGYDIHSYNISLMNANQSYNSSILGNNSQYLNYTWNTTSVPDANYTIMVTAYDSNNLFAVSFSEPFVVDNTPSNITLLNPLNNTIKIGGAVDFLFNITDNYNVTNATLTLSNSINTTCNQNNASDLSCVNPQKGGYLVGGLGSWSCANEADMYDNDWSTYCEYTLALSNEFLYTNYSKPSNYSRALWQIKVGGSSIVNYTIPDHCYNAYADNLSLRIKSDFAAHVATGYCQNSTAWDTVFTIAGGRIYEEEVIWFDQKINFNVTPVNGQTYNLSIPLSPGMYNYFITAGDITNNTNWSLTYNFTLFPRPSNTTLITPKNNYTTNVPGMSFNATIDPYSDEYYIKNYSLYVWPAAGATQIYPGTPFPHQNSILAIDDIHVLGVAAAYKWNIYTCYDNATGGNISCNFGDYNETFMLDYIYPTVDILRPVDLVNYSSIIQVINFTARDIQSDGISSNLQVCWYSNNSGRTNISIGVGAACHNNVTISHPSVYGLNTWLVGVNDSANNSDYEKTTFLYDPFFPNVTFNSPTPANNSYLATDTIPFNLTFADGYLRNSTIFIYNATEALLATRPLTFSGTSSTNDTTFFNASTYGSGEYHYRAVVCDTTNNCNFTQFNVSLDFRNPLIYWVSDTLADGSYLGLTSIWVNASAYDTYLSNITLMIRPNGGAETRVNNSALFSPTNTSFFYNFTGLADGRYNITALATDVVNHMNYSVNRSYYVDGNGPTLAYLSPTPPDETAVTGKTYIPINVSATDIGGVASITIYVYSYDNTTFIASATSLPGETNLDRQFIIADGHYTYNVTAVDMLGNRAWLPRRSVYKENDGPTVSVCRTFSIPGTYNMYMDITDNGLGAGEACMNITVNNVNFNCNSKWLYSNDEANAIYVNPNVKDANIVNCKVDYSSGAESNAVKFMPSSSGTVSNLYSYETQTGVRALYANVKIVNMTARTNAYGVYADDAILDVDDLNVTSSYNGLFLIDVNYSKFKNVYQNKFTNAQTNTLMIRSNYNTFSDINISPAADTDDNGLFRFYSQSSHNIVLRGNMSVAAAGDFNFVNASDGSLNNTLIDVYYASGQDFADSTSQLFRKWTYIATVKDKYGGGLAGSTVTVRASTGQNNSLTTDSVGQVTAQALDYEYSYDTKNTSNQQSFSAVFGDLSSDTDYVNATSPFTTELTVNAEVTSTKLSRAVARILMVMILLISMATSSLYFIYKMRDGDSVADVWKYFVMMVIWNVIFLVLFIVLGGFVMDYMYPAGVNT